MRVVDIGIPGRHDHQVAEQPIRDEGFGAIEHHGITVFFGQGAHAGQVAARIRLGHGHRRDDIA